MNVLEERESKVIKNCFEIYLVERNWILNLEGFLELFSVDFLFYR